MTSDSEAWYAHYALHKLHILPSVFAGMDEREKIFIIASIQKMIDDEEKAREEIEKKCKKR